MKTGNNYLSHLPNFDRTPKAVFAAICVSFINRLGVDFADAEKAINEEWEALHQADIVPQKPLKK